MSVAGSGSSPDLRHQLSGILIQNEEADPEQQPLRRQNSPVANRERFQQNQRTAAQGVVQRSGWILLVVMILVSMLFFVWVVFYFRGWTIWRTHGDKPCDQPLGDWLLIMLLLPLVAVVVECCSCKKLRVLIIFLTLFVLLIGLRMFYKSKTCDDTNPELYTFVRQYLIFLTIWWIYWVVMPLVFVSVVLYGMWHGWFDELNGASPETIKQVETVTFDPAIFAEEGNPDARPAPECCICTETFDSSREIKRTTCQHYFHEECLGKWLRVSTTCPLCRTDLERAIFGDAPSNSAGAAPPQQSSWLPARTAYTEYAAPGAGEADRVTAQEAEESAALIRMFPDLDEMTALMAVRNSGSAEQAAAILGSP